MAVERLRAYREWYMSSSRSSTPFPRLDGTLVKSPKGRDFEDGYTTILRALVKALSLCMEYPQSHSIVSWSSQVWDAVEAEKREHASSTATSQPVICSSEDNPGDNSSPEWDSVQSALSSPLPTISQPSVVPVTSDIRKKVLQQMQADKGCKASPNPGKSSDDSASTLKSNEPIVALPKPSLVKNAQGANIIVSVANPEGSNLQIRSNRVSDGIARPPQLPLVASKPLAPADSTVAMEREAKLIQEIAYLRQESLNEKASREIKEHALINTVTMLKENIREAKKNFTILLARDERMEKEIKTAGASKSHLKKEVSKIAKALDEAHRQRHVARHKLETTLEEVALLKEEAKRARETGRDDIRAEVAVALSGILGPITNQQKLLLDGW